MIFARISLLLLVKKNGAGSRGTPFSRLRVKFFMATKKTCGGKKLVTNDDFLGKVARSGHSKNPSYPTKLWFFARAALLCTTSIQLSTIRKI